MPGVENGEPDGDDRELYLSRFDKVVDLVVDHQQELSGLETTIVDLTGDQPQLIREGLGMDLLKEAVALQGLVLHQPTSV